MPKVEPSELAALLDYAERSRVGDWSLRSALCRYASPQPRKVHEVLTLVRRIEAAIHPMASRLDREGAALWDAFRADEPPAGDDDRLVGMLRAIGRLDELGETLANWADDRWAHHPEVIVDAAIAEVGARLDALGVAHEERVRPPGQRTRG